MAKIETETQDFMNVESFSQLPFIRPSLPLNKDKGIRLFGIEFGSGSDDPESLNNNNNVSSENNNNSNEEEDGSDNKKSNNSENVMSESSRRFECNYCCRNFPTSQALGGHQNAHKRERQHAKREHLQSAMVMHAGGEGHDAAHVYGLMNYSRALASHHHHHQPTYPSWNNTSNYSTSPARLYGSSIHGYGAHHQTAPINGSPLGMWRIPSTVNPRSLMNPLVTPALFSGQEMNNQESRGYVYGSSSSSSSVQQDHVSLDLHL